MTLLQRRALWTKEVLKGLVGGDKETGTSLVRQ
jgi:hypothetical protein